MREKFMRFMYGRYGADRLSKHLVIGALILSLLSTFTGINLFFTLSLVMLIFSYYRIFSKNHTKRYAESRAYEKFWSRAKGYPARVKREAQMRRDYCIFKCPTCRQKIRVPKGRGNVEIRCQKCHTVFRKRT